MKTCVECGREFDLYNETDAAEWYYGHDCEPIARENCERCDSAEPGDVLTYHLRIDGNESDIRRCRDCLAEGATFGVDEWVYRIEPDGTRTDNPFGVLS